MVIDADVRRIPGQYEPDEIQKDMTLAGIDMALVTDRCFVRDDPHGDSLAALQACLQGHEQSLCGIATVDPRFFRPERLRTLKDDFPVVKGIRINSRHCGVALDDFAVLGPLLEELTAQNLPLFAEVTGSTFDLTHPYRLEKLLSNWPPLRVAAVHMGGASRPDFCKDVFKVARRHDNLFLIGSANYWQRVSQAVAAVGAERLLFGSAAPDACFMVSARAAYNALFDLDRLPEKDREAILGDNALKLF